MSRTDLCTITKTCLPLNIYKLKYNITQVYLDQGVVKHMKAKWIKCTIMDPSQGQNTQNNLRNWSKRPWEWQPRSRQRYVLKRMSTLPAHLMVPEMRAPMLSYKGVVAAGPLDVLELLQLSSCPQVPKSQGHLESERLERQMHVSKGYRATFRIQAVQKFSHSSDCTEPDSK